MNENYVTTVGIESMNWGVEGVCRTGNDTSAALLLLQTDIVALEVQIENHRSLNAHKEE